MTLILSLLCSMVFDHPFVSFLLPFELVICLCYLMNCMTNWLIMKFFLQRDEPQQQTLPSQPTTPLDLVHIMEIPNGPCPLKVLSCHLSLVHSVLCMHLARVPLPNQILFVNFVINEVTLRRPIVKSIATLLITHGIKPTWCIMTLIQKPLSHLIRVHLITLLKTWRISHWLLSIMVLINL